MKVEGCLGAEVEEECSHLFLQPYSPPVEGQVTDKGLPAKRSTGARRAPLAVGHGPRAASCTSLLQTCLFPSSDSSWSMAIHISSQASPRERNTKSWAVTLPAPWGTETPCQEFPFPSLKVIPRAGLAVGAVAP